MQSLCAPQSFRASARSARRLTFTHTGARGRPSASISAELAAIPAAQSAPRARFRPEHLRDGRGVGSPFRRPLMICEPFTLCAPQTVPPSALDLMQGQTVRGSGVSLMPCGLTSRRSPQSDRPPMP